MSRRLFTPEFSMSTREYYALPLMPEPPMIEGRYRLRLKEDATDDLRVIADTTKETTDDEIKYVTKYHYVQLLD